MAGSQVGQAYGGVPPTWLLGSVLRYLSTQPPFATQALKCMILVVQEAGASPQ